MRGLHDRLLLVLCALLVGAGMFAWMFVADRQFGLTRERHLFVGGAIAYSAGTLYGLKQHVLRRLDRFAKRALAVMAVEFPVVLFFILFTSGVVPWPLSILPYVVGGALIGPLAIVALDWLFRPPPELPRE